MSQCTPHFLFGLAEKKTGRARSKRKERFWSQLCTSGAKLLYGGRRIGASADLGGSSGTLDSSAIPVTAVPWRRVRRASGCRDAFELLLFYCLALRRSQYFRHQCSTGSSFRAFRCATRCPGSCGGLCWRADESVRPYWACGLRHPRKGRHADRPPQKMHRADGISVGAEALIGPLQKSHQSPASGSEKRRRMYP